MNGLALLIPVLRRPHRVKPLLDSIAAATPEPYFALFIADDGDEEELDALDAAWANYVTIDGNYAQKINAGVALTDHPLVFLGADDLHFHPGWLEAAKRKLRSDVGVVGTNDLCNSRTFEGDHSTHSLLTRRYAELGTVDGGRGPLCELYPHEYCDDELIATAKHRGMYAHAIDSIVEHLHPDAGKAPTDDLYAARPRRMKRGGRIFRSREHLWT